MDAQDVIYAAQKVMVLLDDAQQRVIQELLERAQLGEKVDNFLIDELRKNTKTRRWLQKALGLHGAAVMTYEPLPGDPDSVSAPLYVCPKGDFEWEIRRVGQPIPPCPVHNVPLVPQTEDEA